jgi:hypothetical protein
MVTFFDKRLSREDKFMVDNFHIGMQVYRVESSRKDIGDILKEYSHLFQGCALQYQGDTFWGTKNYFLLLAPKNVMYEMLIDVLQTEDDELYLKKDVNTRTIWEWEERSSSN